MARCLYCPWTGTIYGNPARKEEHYGKMWVIFVCPDCKGDYAYSLLADLPQGVGVKDGVLVHSGFAPPLEPEAGEITESEQLTLGKGFKRAVIPADKFPRRTGKTSKVDIKGDVALDGFVSGQSLDDYKEASQ